jgi:hypothetical protein
MRRRGSIGRRRGGIGWRRGSNGSSMKRCNANRRRRGSIGRRRGINIFVIIVDIIIIIAEPGSLPLSYCIEQFH